MTPSAPAVFAFAILVSPAIAVAQTTGARVADVVTTGMKVSVVDDDGRRIEGRVLERSQESLRLSLNGSSQGIPIDRIVRIDKPDGLKNGALAGLGVGLAIGTFGAVLSSSGNIEPEWMLAGIAYQTVAWTLLAALASTPCSTTAERSTNAAGVSRPACHLSSGAASAARRYQCPGRSGATCG